MFNPSNRQITIFLLIVYTLTRLVSFFTWQNFLAQNIIAASIVIIFLIVCNLNTAWGWTILIGELLLDGAGHFFQFNNLLLRTWLLGIFGLVWIIKKIHHRSPIHWPKKNINYNLLIFGSFLIFSVINGLMRGNNAQLVIQDAILYLFILLIFPTLELSRHVSQITSSLIIRLFIWGTALFTVFTFIIYSAGFTVLNNPYYHWFRNVAAGKITDLGYDFFRIVLPEHLFIVPIILILCAYLIKNTKNYRHWIILLICLTILMLNFTRIYFLGLMIGFLVLAYQEKFWPWLKVGITIAASFLIIFFSVHFIASRGQSLGLELIGFKIAGLTSPTTDVSGAIRMALLPDIKHALGRHPWLGSGLGTEVSYIDPATKQLMWRSQYDWGYLEMMVKLGILGTIAYLGLLVTIAYNLFNNKNNPLAKGLLAGLVALLVVNITTPAIFQGFGVLYLVFIIYFSANENNFTNDVSR